jgi:hypothetical protein
MEAPDGEKVKIGPEVTQGKYFVKFSGTDRPGIYQLLNREQRLTQWAVNYDPVECENASLAPDELKDFVETDRFFVIQNISDIETGLTESRFGTELWKYFAFAALLILLIEMALFREKGEAVST